MCSKSPVNAVDTDVDATDKPTVKGSARIEHPVSVRHETTSPPGPTVGGAVPGQSIMVTTKIFELFHDPT